MAATIPPVVLIKEKIAWFAGLPRGVDSGRSGHHECEFWHQFRVSNESEHPQLRGGNFSVPHYGPKAWGSAYGPLSLGQLLSFCSLLQEALETHHQVTVATEPGDTEERGNVAAMLGGYLILSMGWSLQEVHSHFAMEAGMSFQRCWGEGDPGAPRVVTVADCWSAIALARKQNWIPTDRTWADWSKCIHRMAMQCDCSWLIPGVIAVGADPVTVILDPKPFTLKSLTPKTKDPCASDSTGISFKKGDSGGRLSLSTTCASSSSVPPDFTSDACSCHTVCKEYVYDEESVMYEDCEDEKERTGDFVSWCKASNVQLIVQANLPDEAGLREFGGSYNPTELTSHGLEHFKYTFEDTNGAVPTAACVRSMISTCTDCEALGAVFFHCKGGFGRSVLLACSYIIWKYDVPGRTVLAWVRICRPGAVITPQQEKFLCTKGGRREMERFMHVATDAACCSIA